MISGEGFRGVIETAIRPGVRETAVSHVSPEQARYIVGLDGSGNGWKISDVELARAFEEALFTREQVRVVDGVFEQLAFAVTFAFLYYVLTGLFVVYLLYARLRIVDLRLFLPAEQICAGGVGQYDLFDPLGNPEIQGGLRCDCPHHRVVHLQKRHPIRWFVCSCYQHCHGDRFQFNYVLCGEAAMPVGQVDARVRRGPRQTLHLAMADEQ